MAKCLQKTTSKYFQCLKGQPWYFHYKGWLHTSPCDRSRFWAGVVATTQFWRIWLLHVLETLTVAFCSKNGVRCHGSHAALGQSNPSSCRTARDKERHRNWRLQPCFSPQSSQQFLEGRACKVSPHPHHRLIWSPRCPPSLEELHCV